VIIILKDICAAIFDLDGTLVDSMWVWEKIDIEYLKKRGIALPEDLRDDIAHLSFDDTSKYFKNRFNLEDSIEDIKSEWNDMAFTEYSENVTLKPGVIKFLDVLKKNNIKIALATSNTQLLLELTLKNNGIYHYFDSITTTGEVSKGKDHPDVYLLAAKKLDVPPEKCVVFEDILPAILSAKAAGMRVVGVKDKFASHQETQIAENATLFINDFYDILDAS
jgi:HAD superfamily hydrolase (TIGR01509 family)